MSTAIKSLHRFSASSTNTGECRTGKDIDLGTGRRTLRQGALITGYFFLSALPHHRCSHKVPRESQSANRLRTETATTRNRALNGSCVVAPQPMANRRQYCDIEPFSISCSSENCIFPRTLLRRSHKLFPAVGYHLGLPRWLRMLPGMDLRTTEQFRAGRRRLPSIPQIPLEIPSISAALMRSMEVIECSEQ